MICKNCKTRNEDEAKFCWKCGDNLAEQTPVVFCSGCLEAFEGDGKFCGNCGSPVADGITEDERLNRIANHEKEAIYQQATIDSKVQEEALNEKQRKQKLKRIAFIAVPLCCILIIGVGIGLANIADNPTDTKETAQNDQDVVPTENQTPETTEEETNGNNNISVDPSDYSEVGNEPSYEVPEMDPALQEAAINDAKDMLTNGMGYSRYIVINQVWQDLEWQGLSCTRAIAEYAADNSNANWNEQAVKRAIYVYQYPVEEAVREDLINSLVNNYFFTESQATYAADFYGL